MKDMGGKTNSKLANKEKVTPLRLPCKNCDGRTVHAVLKEVDKKIEDDGIHVSYEYQIVQCQGCEEISFRANWTSSEDIGQDSTTGDVFAFDHEELFPSRIAGRKPLKDSRLLPSKILDLYQETHHALCNRLRILAGVGIRGLIEALCKDRQAQGKNLEEKIDDLMRLGILSTEGAKILHGTRLLGNEAAHEAVAVSDKVLDAAMDVVEHLLIGTFVLPKKSESFPKH